MIPPAIPLRPYQLDAIQKIIATYRAGERQQCLVMATGLGKTVVFSELVRRVDGEALILVHRDELVDQTVDKLKMLGVDPEHIGIVKAQRNEVSAPCVIASVQTVQKIGRAHV